MKVEPYTIEARNKIFLDALTRKDKRTLHYLTTLKNPKRIVYLSTWMDVLNYGFESKNFSDLVICDRHAKILLGRYLHEKAEKGEPITYVFNMDFKGYNEAHDKFKEEFEKEY